MDQELKQRIVGAIVITSLAVIFVPMLFDDPIDQSGEMIGELEIPKLPIQNNSRLLSTPQSIDDVISLPKPKVIKQLESNHVVNNMKHWFLQVGIFGNRDNAVALQKKVKSQGFPVKVKAVTTDKGVMYKVRVGPELDKKRAEDLKVKLDKLNNIKSILSLNDG